MRHKVRLLRHSKASKSKAGAYQTIACLPSFTREFSERKKYSSRKMCKCLKRKNGIESIGSYEYLDYLDHPRLHTNRAIKWATCKLDSGTQIIRNQNQCG